MKLAQELKIPFRADEAARRQRNRTNSVMEQIKTDLDKP